MALTEIQLPTKDEFYNNISSAATNMNGLMHQWQDLAQFIASAGIEDLDAMGIPTGTIRTDIVNFRTVLNEMAEFFNGTSTTQTVIPSDVVDKIRRMR